ncbi:hypothetical protein ABIA39_008665 [Nocardia sp. GAS34]|jgi:hypothetical protein
MTVLDPEPESPLRLPHSQAAVDDTIARWAPNTGKTRPGRRAHI